MPTASCFSAHPLSVGAHFTHKGPLRGQIPVPVWPDPPPILQEPPAQFPLQHVQRLMAEQEAKFQGMLSQLFQHVMAMQNNQMMPTLSSDPPDASMEN